MIDFVTRDKLLRQLIERVCERQLSVTAMADIICQTADGDDLTDDQLRQDADVMALEFRVGLTRALGELGEMGLT